MKQATVALTFVAMAWLARAEDSPQFRGPAGRGVSKEAGLPVQWSAKENVRWKASLPGRGLSCPVVVGDRVLVTACSGVNQDRLHVLCFAAGTGKQLWQRQLWATGTTVCHPKTCMAAPTPVSDGKHIYALFATADLVCYDLDGNLQWYRSLTGDYPTIGNNVGMAASPILWHDLLVVCLENVGASFAAGIDKRTGRNRWKIDRPRGINWATPHLIANQGRPEVLFQTGNELSAHDPATGKLRWSLAGSFATMPSPTWGDGLVFAPGGKFQALRPGSGGAVGAHKPQVVWQSTKLPGGYASPLYYKGLVYMLTARGVLNCADGATGKHLWSRRIEGSFAASPLAADDKVYCVSEEGATTVLQAGADPRVLAVNSLPETFLATPAAASGALFLRSDKHLYCLGGSQNP
jgi:outer membrane protein assembly factor BamB